MKNICTSPLVWVASGLETDEYGVEVWRLQPAVFFFRLAYEKRLISSGQYRQVSERLQEIGRMTGGWLKKC